MKLTKTDFKFYLDCPESLWLKKNKPDKFNGGEFTLFEEKLASEGYEFENYVKKLFSESIDLPDHASPLETQNALEKKNSFYTQPSFSTNKNIFARIDVLELLKNDTWHIYEIKSSTSIKKDRKHRHLEDACFQKYVMQECGYSVSKVSIIHLNKEYVKKGDINPFELAEIVDVTEEVDMIYSQVVNEINIASNYINKEVINENECSCKYKTRSNHCDNFAHFNTNLPEYSIYEIGRITVKKIQALIKNDQISILDIPNDFELNKSQQIQVKSVKLGQPIINESNIKKALNNLKFPLHFMDYETYASAIPKLDRLSPHKHLPFQVSIHTLTEDGELTHFEYILDTMEMPKTMIQEMEKFTAQEGTFISWHASFEIGRNKDLIQWLPELTEYLTYINEHTFDLETIFKKNYIDYRFHGSTSIKKVLPVLCPELSYSDLNVQDGTMALNTWGRMVLDEDFTEDISETRKNLLAYCERDTLAMVEIYDVLSKI